MADLHGAKVSAPDDATSSVPVIHLTEGRKVVKHNCRGALHLVAPLEMASGLSRKSAFRYPE